ncbi:MAG: cytochrome C oxidase subunit IV family protein [Planctomycetota bacterium]|jgi:cytochrome c oxidase subunit 4
MSEHAPSPYYKIFAWLAAFTIAEIAWAVWFVDFRIVLILGLGMMAAVKAALVGLYYMHLKYERGLIWGAILFPVVLVVVMVVGFLPDALFPYGS